MVIANLALRFALELFGIGALAYWGFTSANSVVPPVVLGVGAALALIVVWSLVAAPKARNPLRQRQRSLIGTGLLLGTAVALGATGQPGVALAFAVLVVANQGMLILFGDDLPESLGSPSRGN
jgi:predicted acyltransferase